MLRDFAVIPALAAEIRHTPREGLRADKAASPYGRRARSNSPHLNNVRLNIYL